MIKNLTSLNGLNRGLYRGSGIGKGDDRSLDNGSHASPVPLSCCSMRLSAAFAVSHIRPL